LKIFNNKFGFELMDISKTRKLSLIGSLLLLIPGLNIVGLILIVISLKELAEYYKGYPDLS
jgi:uncharacterized membrane protein